MNQSYFIILELNLEEDSKPIVPCFAHRLVILAEHKLVANTNLVELAGSRGYHTLVVGILVEAAVAVRNKLVAAISCKHVALSDAGIQTKYFGFPQRTI